MPINRDNTNQTPATPEEQIKASKIFFAIGVMLIVFFLLTIAYSIYENSKTISVDGTVIEYISETSIGRGPKRDSKKIIGYDHLFSYINKKGQKQIGKTITVRDSHLNIGDVVSIGYYPDDYSQVRIQSWFGLWKLQLILLSLGALLIWYSYYSIKLIKKEMSEGL